MHRVSALIAGCSAFVPALVSIAEPPRYTIQPLSIASPPGVSIGPEELGEGSTILGYGSQGASCQFVWTDGVFRYAPIPCWQSEFGVLLPDGVAAGSRRFGTDERSYPAIFDGTSVIDLPTITPPGWIPIGKVLGGTWPAHVFGHAGYKAAQWINGELSLLPVPDGCEQWQPVVSSGNGTLLGLGCGGLVLYRNAEASTLAYPEPIAPPSQGYLYYWDYPRAVNDSGMLVIQRWYVVKIDAGDPISKLHTFIHDGSTWHELPYAMLPEITNAGQVFGNQVVWDRGQVYALSGLVDDLLRAVRVLDSHPDGRLLVELSGSLVGGETPPTSYAILLPQPAEPPICRVDWDANGVVNSTDVSQYINDWFQSQATGECP